MISVECNLLLESDGFCYTLTKDAQRQNQLVLEIPSLAAGLKLARDASGGPLRSLVWSFQATGWLDQIRLALRYRNLEIVNQSLQAYARLETLWSLSGQWRRVFGSAATPSD